jgi:hypothetical protein
VDRRLNGRLKVTIVVSSLIPTVAIYEICVRSAAHGIGKLPFSTGLFFAGVALTLMAWIWYRVLERSGYVASSESVPVPARSWANAAACVAVMAGMTVLETVIYAATGSRFVELAVAVAVGSPAMVELVRMGAFTPVVDVRRQSPISRLQLAIYPLIFALLSFDLVITVGVRSDTAIDGLHEFAVAALAFVVVSTPFIGYVQWKRYTQQQRARMLRV